MKGKLSHIFDDDDDDDIVCKEPARSSYWHFHCQVKSFLIR